MHRLLRLTLSLILMAGLSPGQPGQYLGFPSLPQVSICTVDGTNAWAEAEATGELLPDSFGALQIAPDVTNQGSYLAILVHASINPSLQSNLTLKAASWVYPALQPVAPTYGLTLENGASQMTAASVIQQQSTLIGVRARLFRNLLQECGWFSPLAPFPAPNAIKGYGQYIDDTTLPRNFDVGRDAWNPASSAPKFYRRDGTSTRDSWLSGPQPLPPGASSSTFSYENVARNAMRSQLIEAHGVVRGPQIFNSLAPHLDQGIITLTFQAVILRTTWTARSLTASTLTGLPGLDCVSPTGGSPLPPAGPPNVRISLPLSVSVRINSPYAISDGVAMLALPDIPGFASDLVGFVGDPGAAMRIFHSKESDERTTRIIAIPVIGGTYTYQIASYLPVESSMSDYGIWEFDLPPDASVGVLFVASMAWELMLPPDGLAYQYGEILITTTPPTTPIPFLGL